MVFPNFLVGIGSLEKNNAFPSMSQTTSIQFLSSNSSSFLISSNKLVTIISYPLTWV